MGRCILSCCQAIASGNDIIMIIVMVCMGSMLKASADVLHFGWMPLQNIKTSMMFGLHSSSLKTSSPCLSKFYATKVIWILTIGYHSAVCSYLPQPHCFLLAKMIKNCVRLDQYAGSKNWLSSSTSFFKNSNLEKK